MNSYVIITDQEPTDDMYKSENYRIITFVQSLGWTKKYVNDLLFQDIARTPE